MLLLSLLVANSEPQHDARLVVSMCVANIISSLDVTCDLRQHGGSWSRQRSVRRRGFIQMWLLGDDQPQRLVSSRSQGANAYQPSPGQVVAETSQPNCHMVGNFSTPPGPHPAKDCLLRFLLKATFQNPEFLVGISVKKSIFLPLELIFLRFESSLSDELLDARCWSYNFYASSILTRSGRGRGLFFGVVVHGCHFYGGAQRNSPATGMDL